MLAGDALDDMAVATYRCGTLPFAYHSPCVYTCTAYKSATVKDSSVRPTSLAWRSGIRVLTVVMLLDVECMT